MEKQNRKTSHVSWGFLGIICIKSNLSALCSLCSAPTQLFAIQKRRYFLLLHQIQSRSGIHLFQIPGISGGCFSEWSAPGHSMGWFSFWFQTLKVLRLLLLWDRCSLCWLCLRERRWSPALQIMCKISNKKNLHNGQCRCCVTSRGVGWQKKRWGLVQNPVVCFLQQHNSLSWTNLFLLLCPCHCRKTCPIINHLNPAWLLCWESSGCITNVRTTHCHRNGEVAGQKQQQSEFHVD